MIFPIFLALSGVSLPVGEFLCRPQIEKFLQDQNATTKWVRVPDPEVGVVAHRAPTRSFGRWVELRVATASKNAGVIVVTDTNTRFHSWTDCDHPVVENKTPAKSGSITDAKIQSQISGASGIIYLKAEDANENEKAMLENLARQRKLKLISVPEDSFSSIELKMRGAGIEFPALLLFKNGKLEDRLLNWTGEAEDLSSRLDSHFGRRQ